MRPRNEGRTHASGGFSRYFGDDGRASGSLGRWLAAAAILVVLAAIGRAFVNGQIEWTYVSRFLTAKVILEGITNTMVMAVLRDGARHRAGRGRRDHGDVVQSGSDARRAGYIWFFRGTPLMLQLLLWFNLALVFPTIGIPGLWSSRGRSTSSRRSSRRCWAWASIRAPTRPRSCAAGMLSVDVGQTEAAQGDRHDAADARCAGSSCRRRCGSIIPPVGNELIGMVKAHLAGERHPVSRRSCATPRTIYYANARVIELLIVAGDLVSGRRHGAVGRPAFPRAALLEGDAARAP